MTITKEFNHEFNASSLACGSGSFLKLCKLQDPQVGFLMKDACIVGVEDFVCKSTLENQMNQAANVTVSLMVGRQTGHMKVEVPMPNPTQVCIEHFTKQR